MDLHRAADKLQRELDILDAMDPSFEGTHEDIQHIELLLAQTKRVRNASTVLVRELARKRDELQP